MIDVLVIRTLVNYGDNSPRTRQGGSGTRLYLQNHWSKFPLENIAQFQKDTPDYFMLYAVSSKWH